MKIDQKNMCDNDYRFDKKSQKTTKFELPNNKMTY